jgi:hypothetical protein
MQFFKNANIRFDVRDILLRSLSSLFYPLTAAWILKKQQQRRTDWYDLGLKVSMLKNFPGFFRQVSPFVSSRSCSSCCSTYFFFTDWMLIIFSTFILMTIILKDVKSCVWGGYKWVIELRIYLPRNYTGWCKRKGNFSIPSPSVHSCCKYLPVPGQVSR